jgi:hypothetical protein
MSFWTFVFLTSLLVFAIPLSAIWTEHLRRTRDHAGTHARDINALKEEVERLRERTEVLEAIVTDRRFALGREIDALDRSSARRPSSGGASAAP